MDTTLLILAIIVVILPTAMLTSMFLLRGGSAHSERIDREQERLDRKNGIAPRTRTAPENASENKKLEWVKSNLLTILFVFVGVMLVYWGFQNIQIRPADAGSWSWAHWLPLLIIWGTLSVLIALNKKALGEAATVLQTVLAIAVVALLVILPLWHWAEKPSATTSHTTRSEIPLASSPQSTWPKLTMEPGGRSEPIRRPPGMKVRMAGYDFVQYSVYLGGKECSSREVSCPESPIEVYARNEASEKNTIAYAFVPD